MAEQQQPPIFQYKVSLETTTKSVQPQITVYSNDSNTVVSQAIEILNKTCQELRQQGYKVADIFATNAGSGKEMD